jgi:hypothetical protein
MPSNRCVPQTAHTEGKNTPVVTVVITENSRKAYLCVSTVSTCKLLNIFTRILNNNSNKADTLTTADPNRISRKLLSQIICVNLANIIHTHSSIAEL